MKLLQMEFYKCRRRKILLVCAAVLAVQMLWMGVFFARQDAEDLRWGWMLLLYNLCTIDAIILPLSVATLASRNCELEHRGSTWKLLETMVSPGSLYGAKLGWGALVLAVLLILRSGLFLGVGIAQGFQGAIPWGRFGLFTLLSWAVSMMVYALQQGLSLRFANQAAALVCGISGSFLGILSMMFPPALVRCVPWGYYGLMSLVYMDWNKVTRVTRFYWRELPVTDVVLLLLWAAVFLIVGRTLFVRKEV
ncbi:ABC transporter permease [Candidatus Agathobaculum pullicola]|uniref:ABC transporter permease n=1 Tax=Candidatus Agathobaculum pullicola TaxID=2838426 RepID=UPI003F8E0D75